jgi:addiction module HigA family antidote
MGKSRKMFAVHPGEILKTEFRERMGLSAYELAKALNFPGIDDVARGDRALSADTAIRSGKYFGLPAQFWFNLQNDCDLRIAEGGGIGKGIRPRKVAYHAEGADARYSITMRSLLAPSALTPSLPSAGPSTPRPSAADRVAETLDGT